MAEEPSSKRSKTEANNMPAKKLGLKMSLAVHVNKFRKEYLPYIREDVKKHFNDFKTLADIYNYLFVIYFDTLWN